MKKYRLASGLGALAVASVSTSVLAAPAPSGPHPRIWIGPAALGAIKAHAAEPSSAASRVLTECDKILSKPDEMKQAGIQGYNWAWSSATCALAWKIGGKRTHADAAVTLFRAMLDDYVTIGDGAGGDDVVRHDTGYAMRFFGAYSALAYDWLHDAPGVDAALLAHARARFKAWTDWNDTSGYLKDMPGSNYHAGYVFAKTLIAVAEGGEDGAVSDAYWNDVTTRLVPKTLVQSGLGDGGVLRGGDWPEGWQYGPPSVLSYALAGRALAEQGVPQPELAAWADTLVQRFRYGMTPNEKGMWVAGDLDDNTELDAPLNPRTLIAAIAGPAGDKAAGWAAHMKATVAKSADPCPVFDALAEARAVTPSDFLATSPAPVYLARGAGNLYTRSSWDKNAMWAVFTASPKLVADHQHADASNFVFYRGGDRLIVDPSPYGSRSSLTGNAISVDSQTVRPAYRPSQSPFSRASMPWARATTSGVVAARAELADAFRDDSAPSDVPFARRDWVFLPEGEIVTVDRVRTGDAKRNTYLRFRTPGGLAFSGETAIAPSGSSRLAIHPVRVSGGKPQLGKVAHDDCWTSTDYGKCRGARIAVEEYSLEIPGPQAHAVHVLDGLDASEPVSVVKPIDDPAVAPSNAGLLGAQIDRGARRTFVLDSSSQTGAVPSSLTYEAPADTTARHVVFDAPEDAAGKATVTATPSSGGRCAIAIVPGGAKPMEGRPLVFSVARAADGCAVTEDGATSIEPAAPGDAPPSSPNGGGESTGNGGGTTSPQPSSPGASTEPSPAANGGEGGCAGCTTSRAPARGVLVSLAGLLALGLGRRRRSTR